jgi:CRP-like cAMP-binding protein
MNNELLTLESSLIDYFEIESTQAQVLSSQFTQRQVEKGAYLLKQGQTCKSLDFIASGVLRIFATLENGKEVTQWIGLPGSFVTELSGLMFDLPARWNIQCLTDCDLYSVSKDSYRNLTKSFNNWSEIEKAFLAKCFVTLEDRVFGFLSMTAEERFEQLMRYAPEVFQSASQQYVASMLGMTPETFSRIRKKMVS